MGKPSAASFIWSVVGAKKEKKESWERKRTAPPSVPLPAEPEKPAAVSPAPPVIPPLDLSKPITDEHLEKVLLAQALFDARRCVDENGRGLLLSELDEWTALALASFDVEEIYDWEYNEAEGRQARVNIGTLKKYKIEWRQKAIELLWKYRGKLNGDAKREDKKNLLLEYMAAIQGR